MPAVKTKDANDNAELSVACELHSGRFQGAWWERHSAGTKAARSRRGPSNFSRTSPILDIFTFLTVKSSSLSFPAQDKAGRDES